jgi:hypothetical protein
MKEEQQKRIRDKEMLLNSIISNCQIMAKGSTICEMKIDTIRARINECKTEKELDEMAFQVIGFVDDFMTYRY